MSFILDALRKSETERQQQGPTEFTTAASSTGSASGPKWLWIVGILLAINLAVLIGLLLRSGDDTELAIAPLQRPDTVVRNVITPGSSESSFTDQVAAAQQNTPHKQVEAATDDAIRANDADAVSTTVVAEIIAANPDAIKSTEVYPTIFAVRANGAIDIPDLHLDFHVYSDVPENRFVFINMSKHREGSQLEEGPVVDKITPDGVVLGHRGIRFLLPRD